MSDCECTNDLQNIVNRLLPSVSGFPNATPVISSSTKRPGHVGIDIVYWDPVVKSNHPINEFSPTVSSPISGKITGFNPSWGLIEITDDCGYRHQILHLSGFNPSLGKGGRIEAGQPIGYMGSINPKGLNLYPHVHYQILKPAGLFIDPQDELGSKKWTPST